MYNYGGELGLYNAKLAGKVLFDFNPEQQAEILADYYDYIHGNFFIDANYSSLLHYYSKSAIGY